MEHIVKALQKPVMLKVLLCLLFLFDYHHLALATSAGGVMGGSDFSSFSDRYSSSASDSSYSTYSSGSKSSYSSYSSGSKSSYSSYSSGSKSSYSSYSSLPCYCHYNEREDGPHVPAESFNKSPRKAVNVVVSSDSSNSSSHAHPTSPIGSTDIFLFIGFVAFFLICCYICNRSSDLDKGTSFKTSVFKLQVGLLGTARSLQKDLNEIAKTTNTSTSDGFRHILKATIAALLQHPDYYTSGYSYVDHGSSVKEAEKRFQKLSSDERSKFDEETLVNLNNIIKKSATSQKSDDEYIVVETGSKFDEEPWVNLDNVRKRNATSQMSNGVCNKHIVVTIIVAACGLHTLPPIKSNAELKKALQMLAFVPSSKIMAAMVLWTPQKKDDTLSEQELRADYPLLCPLFSRNFVVVLFWNVESLVLTFINMVKVDVKSNVKEAEKLLKKISVEGKGKSDDETLVNVNSIRKEIATSQLSNGVAN
ncbi:hypothetical protein CTI12_AA454450 [Artemisia annua]|uniref:Uncharacterized protein n=1 Tax=Artemisia annua TaxID=35608 RepID=A0A2U1LU16_ARTAN|nr:hypothetical protein CTI12_AA454450 [Artemisia annua]